MSFILTEKSRRAVASQYLTGKITNKSKLAVMYGVSPRTISRCIEEFKSEYTKPSKLTKKAIEEKKEVSVENIPAATASPFKVGDKVIGNTNNKYFYTCEGVVVEVLEITGNNMFKGKIVEISDSFCGTNNKRTTIEKIIDKKLDFDGLSFDKFEKIPSFSVGDLITKVKEPFYNYTSGNSVSEVVHVITPSDNISQLEKKYDTIIESCDDILVKVIASSDYITQSVIKAGTCHPVESSLFAKVGHVSEVSEFKEEAVPTEEVKEEVTGRNFDPDNIAYNITPKSVSMVFLDTGETLVADSSSKCFAKASAALFEGNYEEAVRMLDLPAAITSFVKGLLVIKDGTVFFDGQPVQGDFVNKLLSLMAKGDEGYKALANFFLRVVKNPSYKTRYRLLSFAAVDNIDIDEEGFVIAYKNTKEDGCSSRSGKWIKNEDGTWFLDKDAHYEHIIGVPLEMPREQVDDDESHTCSTGLHVCSLRYMKECWGTSGRNFKVKVDPEDFVAIPPDYKDSKARTCRYTPIEEVSAKRLTDLYKTL